MYNLQSWSVQGKINPKAIKKAEGIYLYDYDGQRYSDMSSQLVNMNLGHGNKEIVEAIREQAGKFCYMAPSYAVESRGNLAELIIKLMPDNMGKVFFTNAGADANENAIKIARMYTGRQKIFSRYRSYHGSTYGAANLTESPGDTLRNPAFPASSISSIRMCTGKRSPSKARKKPPGSMWRNSENRFSMRERTMWRPSLWRPSPVPTA